MKGAAAVTLAVTMAGCAWSQPGFDAGGSGSNPTEWTIRAENVASLEQQWTAPLDVAPTGYIVQSARGTLHALDQGAAYGIDLDTGARTWRTPLAGLGSTRTNPSADPRSVLVGTYDQSAAEAAQVQQLDAVTGAVLAPIDLPQTEDLGSLAVANVNTVQSRRWRVSTLSTGWALPPFGPFVTNSAFAVAGARRGDPSWNRPSAADSLGNPVIVGDRFYATTTDLTLDLAGPTVITTAQVVGWDLDDPCTDSCEPDVAVELPLEVPGRLSAAPDGRMLYVQSAGKLQAIDVAAESVEWTSAGPVTYPAEANAPTVTGRSVFLAGTRPNVLASYPSRGCGAATCPAEWTATLPGAPVGQPAAAGGLLFVGTADGTLAAYATGCTGECQPLWSVQLGSAVTAAPVVTDGRVIVGTAAGVTAFGLPEG